MKKTFIIVVICITTMVCMMSCSNNKPSEVTEKPVEEEVETVEKSEVGTYTFSDYLQKYELTLNNDGTAVLNATRMNLTDYGSWETWRGNSIYVKCSGDQFRISLPDGSSKSPCVIFLKDGYVYFGSTELEAKHPKKRLAYTKR